MWFVGGGLLWACVSLYSKLIVRIKKWSASNPSHAFVLYKLQRSIELHASLIVYWWFCTHLAMHITLSIRVMPSASFEKYTTRCELPRFITVIDAFTLDCIFDPSLWNFEDRFGVSFSKYVAPTSTWINHLCLLVVLKRDDFRRRKKRVLSKGYSWTTFGILFLVHVSFCDRIEQLQEKVERHEDSEAASDWDLRTLTTRRFRERFYIFIINILLEFFQSYFFFILWTRYHRLRWPHCLKQCFSTVWSTLFEKSRSWSKDIIYIYTFRLLGIGSSNGKMKSMIGTIESNFKNI